MQYKRNENYDTGGKEDRENEGEIKEGGTQGRRNQTLIPEVKVISF